MSFTIILPEHKYSQSYDTKAFTIRFPESMLVAALESCECRIGH